MIKWGLFLISNTLSKLQSRPAMGSHFKEGAVERQYSAQLNGDAGL
jgi:hypothetical protein